ncbi:MAG: hypothetical protein FWC17_02820 [Treponema sp.]|nr:hypothetical protein [Treponema sp.]MCL2266685.1 hypothetical protein [Treponema sp.]
MDKKILLCAAVIFAIAALLVFAWNNLEIYQDKRFIFPSDEIMQNNFYAMDQWLSTTGHKIRIENYFNPIMLSDAAENVIMVNSNAYSWRSMEEILRWIEQGGYFILDLASNNRSLNNNILEFLSGFGINVEYTQQVYTNEAVEEEEPADVVDKEDAYPDFQTLVAFSILKNEKIFTMKDADGNIRLVEIPIGSGSLTVTGVPVFMYNNNLRKEANAALAWKLTGARTASPLNAQENKGIFFIRTQNVNTAFSFFGSIIERGNFLPVIIAAFILIAAGFWMVIPSFGKVSMEKRIISRPIKDRLTAEIRFLKKHSALDYYLDTLSGGGNNNETYNYKDLINQYRRKLNESERS